MNKQHRIVIIGAGFAGLCMGIKLKLAGINDFVIFEKAEDLGGTWRENTYPGAECDIPSALYSYSFEHNSKWEYKWSGQQQILKYQHDTANKYGLREHLTFNRELTAAKFNDSTDHWELDFEDGQTVTAQHLIMAIGQLHHPSIPEFTGASQFQGHTFHSAQWNHDVDLTDKRVAVIGNAASAVQFVPKIAPQVKHLTIFQRSPNWMLPKMDRPYTRFEQWVSEKVPPITKLYRLNLWLKGELGILPAIRRNRFSRWLLRKLSLSAMRKVITDTQLQEKLTPNYPIGAKRILFADEYYPALMRDNVHLDTSGVECFTTDGIQRKDGVTELFDVVIYSTGFKTNPFLSPMTITGVGGKTMREHWRDGARAYLGVSTHGFPNLHMMYGPNTNLGHNSIIIMIEAQANYIRQIIEAAGEAPLQVKPAIEAAYNEELQTRLSLTAFAEVAESWYLDGGKITNNWAGGTREYMRRLKRFDATSYQSI